MKYKLIIIFSLFAIISCAGHEPELEISITYEKESGDYQTYTYEVTAEEISDVCTAKNVKVRVTTYINDSFDQENKYNFGTVEAGDSEKELETINTPGRVITDSIRFQVTLDTGEKLFKETDCPIYATNQNGRPYDGNIMPAF